MKMRSFRALLTVILSILALTALRCTKRGPTSPQGEEAIQESGFVQLNIQMSKPLAHVIDRVVVIAENPSKGRVAGELSIDGKEAKGRLEVPAGCRWTITAEAYISGVVCYSGQSQAIYVTAGEEIPVTITVDPLDSDGDGFYNHEDLFPKGNAKIQAVLKRFTVFCNDGAWDTDSEIYFIIKVGEVNFRAQPSGRYWWKCGVGDYVRPNWSTRLVDVADSSRYHEINIQMWDDDGLGADDLYDIDADATKSLNLRYDLKTGRWTGDDTDGITKGIDGYLEYDIKTVVK
ncbi:hypothetical protein J7M00_09690 [bacterium]|nr:hypothetical protein [bacterium]